MRPALLLAATALLAAADPPAFAWAEGEAPARRPELPDGFPASGVRYGDAWGLSRIMSGGKLLHVNLPDGEVAKWVPEGLTFAYDLNVAGGKQELWARIGYEFARSPIRWRVGGGAWQDLAPDALTSDIEPIQTWNELAWARLGEVEAPAGKLTLELQWPRPVDAKGKVGRILGMLDAVCAAAPGVFVPCGPWQPGQDHRGDADRAAAAEVFHLPGAAAGGERSQIALTGAWEMASWEESAPADRLGPAEALPPASAQLRWSAYRVPGDRNAQRPDLAYQHRMVARCRVDVPADLAGRSFVLDVQRFNTIATIFVNGVRCGWSRAHSTAWQPDLTAAIKPGQVNEIAIVIKDRYYAIDPARDHGNKLGWAHYRNLPGGFLDTNQGTGALMDLAVMADGMVGITEPATLIAAGPTYVADCFVKPSLKDKAIAVEVTLANPGAARSVELACAALPWAKAGDGEAAKTFKPLTVALAAGETKTVELREAWADPQLWWPDDVHLYDLVATVTANGKPIDVSRTRFGFREWSWDGDQFRLNGVRWQLFADCDVNFDPKALVEQRKRSGQNCMRLWANGGLGGMTRRATLDFMDENGICVRSSGIMDGEAANYGGGLVEEVEVDGKKVRRAKAALFDHWKEQLAAWVRAERNHASLMIWSVENEVTYINACNLGMAAQVEPVISDALRNLVMKLDPTRPAMVDGGNAHKDESLPVNGAHYTEMYNTHWRDFPDSAYGTAHWYLKDAPSRGMWRMAPGKPIFAGEVFFAAGYTTDQFATIGGERCFIGVGETGDAMRRLGQVFNEGWRWAGVAAWHHWLSGGRGRYWNGWQPVAVLSREWATSFGPGQQVVRDLKVLNNTSSAAPIAAAWELRLDGKRVAGGSRDLALAPGAEAEWKVEFAIPAVKAATTGAFVLSASRAGAEIYRDERAIRVLVPAALPKPALKPGELAVHDPKGMVAAWLKANGIPFTATATLDEIPEKAKVLVVGPDAIPATRVGDPLWYARAQRGLRVVVLDQRYPLRYRALPADLEPLDEQPSVWARMQAEAAKAEPELRGRYGFAEDPGHPAFAGLIQDDFFTWGQDHVVYRNPYRKGSKGFRSLFQCEEGLGCTALAECQAGEGLMLLSQLAIGEKIASEAVAQQVFAQLLSYAASYAPVRRPISIAASPAVAAAVQATGFRQETVADPLAAIAKDGIAVVEATPSALAALAAKADAVRAWCAKGNWMMLWGATPESLADLNKLLRTRHVMRKFETERVLLAVPADPLTAGLTLRDVVLDTGQQMYPWMALKRPDGDEFTWIVDHTDIAPFCAFPSPTAMGKKSDSDPGVDHWPRNMVNGFTSADNWCFCYTIVMDQGHKLKWTMTLPQEEEITALKIRPSSIYHPITQVKVTFDDDPTPVVGDLRVEAVDQEIAFPARKAKAVTVEISKWAERGAANIVVVDNLWLMVKRDDAYLARVKPLLNLGGLMRYDEGKGGFVLNQLKLAEREANPANAGKKLTIVKTILANLGAISAGKQQGVTAADQLKYEPIALPVERCTANVVHDRQPAWWEGPADLSALPNGEQVFAGVRWLLPRFTTSPVPTAFMLRGRGGTVGVDKIEGLKVGKKADALCFLHTHNDRGDLGRHLEWMKQRRQQGQDPGDVPAVLTYVVHYADGQTAEVPVRWNRDIGNWLAKQPLDLPNATVAWTGKAGEQQVVVWSMTWANPRPEVEIASIDLRAGEERWGSPAVLAVSAATRIPGTF